MQRLFGWSKHPFWEITGTRLTFYVGTCKDCLGDQDIPSEKSEAPDSQPMLRLFEWSGHLSEKSETLDSQAMLILFEWSGYSPAESEALDSHTMFEYVNHVWVIRTFLLKKQRYWTHTLYWNMQRLVEWSGQPFPEIRGIGLTCYVGTCKGVWVIRISLLKNQKH